MEVEKRSSKGGFLQLFDWNVKSRKKLFSNKPETSTQAKDNLAISRLHQMKLHDASNDDGPGTKPPGVVARLMGLDSFPTLDASDPGFTPFIDSHSFRHSEHHVVDYGMRNKLDGFSRNPVQDRLQKLHNRPIERFQTEVLPPRSAKSVPISHHKMLSPIKTPGFILSRNAAYIMEAASKMIEQTPHSNISGRQPSFASSSIPLRIRDLKEKMEAAHQTSQTPKSNNNVNSSKSQLRDKRQCQSEIVVLKQKNKSVSPSTPAKTNSQKLEGNTSSNMMKQKGDVQLDKKPRYTPKRVQNRLTAGRTPEVLTQNNQKQNSASHKDRMSLKPRVPYQHDRKTASTNGIKTSKNSVVGARKVQLGTSETGKETLTKTKTFSGKKRPTEGNSSFDGTTTNNELIKEKERSVKCNITIDGSSNWESVDRKNGMDVVSFTFTSPIKKSVSESESSGQSGVKNRCMCLMFEDQPDMGTSEFPSLETPVIDSDALSVLLEQKLRELSSLVETSRCDVESSASAKNDKMFQLNMQNNTSDISHDSDVSLVDQILVKAKPEWQGVEVAEYRSGIKHESQNLCTSPSLEPSLSDDSYITSNSTATLTSSGNMHNMCLRNMELEDSATSFANTLFEFTSMPRWTSQWELEYIRQVLDYAELVLEDLCLGRKVINLNVFDQLENQNKSIDPLLKLQRKVLFDCVSLCLESRRECALSGNYEEWKKWSKMFKKKDLLADQIQKEISGWTHMEDLNVDEVVEKDMSSGTGKWLDFECEALAEATMIENDILTDLIDEIVADFCLFF